MKYIEKILWIYPNTYNLSGSASRGGGIKYSILSSVSPRQRCLIRPGQTILCRIHLLRPLLFYIQKSFICWRNILCFIIFTVTHVVITFHNTTNKLKRSQYIGGIPIILTWAFAILKPVHNKLYFLFMYCS